MLPSVTDVARNAVLAFSDNLITCNAQIRHFREFNDEGMMLNEFEHLIYPIIGLLKEIAE